jgi:hypothetical protein
VLFLLQEQLERSTDTLAELTEKPVDQINRTEVSGAEGSESRLTDRTDGGERPRRAGDEPSESQRSGRSASRASDSSVVDE